MPFLAMPYFRDWAIRLYRIELKVLTDQVVCKVLGRLCYFWVSGLQFNAYLRNNGHRIVEPKQVSEGWLKSACLDARVRSKFFLWFSKGGKGRDIGRTTLLHCPQDDLHKRVRYSQAGKAVNGIEYKCLQMQVLDHKMIEATTYRFWRIWIPLVRWLWIRNQNISCSKDSICIEGTTGIYNPRIANKFESRNMW